MKTYSLIPNKMFYCAKCGEQLFYSTEGMILYFLKLDVNDTYYDDTWEYYDEVVDCENKYDYKGWVERNDMHHELLFRRAFGTHEFSAHNKRVCQYCNHENTYDSFYVNDEFIMNQR